MKDTPFVPIEKIVALCKRRGFVYPNSEIYGGVAGIYDFGPLGVELRNNIRRYWWWTMVQMHDNVVGIEGAIITHPRVWEASGHVENFVDRLGECKTCKRRFRVDQLPVYEVFDMARSEEHTSELQSHSEIVCRLLLAKKKKHVCTFDGQN